MYKTQLIVFVTFLFFMYLMYKTPHFKKVSFKQKTPEAYTKSQEPLKPLWNKALRGFVHYRIDVQNHQIYIINRRSRQEKCTKRVLYKNRYTYQKSYITLMLGVRPERSRYDKNSTRSGEIPGKGNAVWSIFHTRNYWQWAIFYQVIHRIEKRLWDDH